MIAGRFPDKMFTFVIKIGQLNRLVLLVLTRAISILIIRVSIHLAYICSLPRIISLICKFMSSIKPLKIISTRIDYLLGTSLSTSLPAFLGHPSSSSR